MAKSQSNPLSFSFMNLSKPLVEFKGDSRPEDAMLRKCDVHGILLFTYDWTIARINMMKSTSESINSPVFSVGPCQNFDLKLFLTSTGGDSFKIEVLLVKEIRMSNEMKLREFICPLASQLAKHTLSLEFLDNNGKRIDYYKCLPYEFKYINTCKVFAWTKELNVTRFICNDSLTIRAKLSMRFYSHSPEVDDPIDESTNILRRDLKNLFNERNSYFPDILIKVGGEYVPCHKSIIYSQYPCFPEFAKIENIDTSINSIQNISKLPSNISSMISNNCETLHILNESVDVFLSALHFIYSKRMLTSETLDDFAVYEFAEKYGICDLSVLLMPTEMEVHSKIIVKKIKFIWHVNKFSSLNKSGFSPTQSPEFKTEIGNEIISWTITLICLDSKNIILNLQRMNCLKSDVQTVFKLGLRKANGSIYDEREFKHLFTSGTIQTSYPGFMESVSHFSIVSDLLYNDNLTVYCDLTVSNGEISSDIKHCYPNDYPAIDINYWVSNLHNLYESGMFSDAILIVDEVEFKVHRAILAARSPVFARMFESDMAEKNSGYVRIQDTPNTVMKLALSYIYDGKIDDLTLTDAPDLYCLADKYAIMDLKNRCSEFMVQNVDAESACEILIMATLYEDEKLKEAAKNIICRNATQALLSPQGLEFISNHSHLVHDIFETLSAAFCSLHPQVKLQKL